MTTPTTSTTRLPLAPARALTLLVALLIAAAFLLPRPAAAFGEGEAKVVYHADFADPRRFSAMLTSINNMVTHYNDNLMDYDVRIVFVSHGIRFLTDNPLENTPFAEDEALREARDNLRGRLSSLRSVHNVQFELCDITRSAVQLDEGDFYEGVELVPSGVVRIAELQSEEGFSYLKIE
ncbi:DsrE family protein [Ectothiorhodospiraceae bacterium 2226]|nr:DsrE family protein [Ectothiorhodospiraceae bacterium 2226]